MHYSQDHLWFKDVRWKEKGISIQCLVDTSITDIQSGYYLLSDDDGLSVHASGSLSPDTLLKRNVIGKAIRWSVYEK